MFADFCNETLARLARIPKQKPEAGNRREQDRPPGERWFQACVRLLDLHPWSVSGRTIAARTSGLVNTSG